MSIIKRKNPIYAIGFFNQALFAEIFKIVFFVVFINV